MKNREKEGLSVWFGVPRFDKSNPYNLRLTEILQPPMYYYCITIVLPLYYNFITIVLQLYYHRITTVLLSYYHCITTLLPSYYYCITLLISTVLLSLTLYSPLVSSQIFPDNFYNGLNDKKF